MPSKTPSPSVLLKSVARRILGSSGLIQKGRSRIWLADQVWWMIVVEFQPSGWRRGSYLNVGCMWLWNVKPYISFDVGYRVEKFYAFENDEQFNRVAEKLATHALEKVRGYHVLFQTFRHVSDYYMQNIPKSFWPCFNASIAHCLAGRTELGGRLLCTCTEGTDGDQQCLKEARSDAQSLLEIIEDEERLRNVLTGRIQEARRIHKLPLVEIDVNSRFSGWRGKSDVKP